MILRVRERLRRNSWRRAFRYRGRAARRHAQEDQRMTSFPLRLPADLKEKATAQAEAAGVSLNQYIAMTLASWVGARAKAECSFTARGSRAKAGQAKTILAKAGKRSTPRPADRRDLS